MFIGRGMMDAIKEWLGNPILTNFLLVGILYWLDKIAERLGS
jgi:hypothetical protein